jgi:peptidoglycan/xylan/chitin deacetylase (PgdA/CDA1 family)
MSAHDFNALVSAGMEIGFHTAAHDPLTHLSDCELEAALGQRDDLGQPAPSAVSYPHGRADARVADAARAAGFTVGFTTAGTRIEHGDDSLLLGRFEASPRTHERFVYTIARALA